jgi:hypothetical protein
VAIHHADGVAALSRHCWNVDREVFVCHWKLWNVYCRPDDTFLDLVC